MKKWSLHGSFLAMGIFIAAAVAINGGFKNFIIFIIIPAVCIVAIYFIGKYSEFWAVVVLSLLSILAVHYFAQLWVITIVAFCFFAINIII